MPAGLPQKLKIKEGYTLLALNAPADFEQQLEGLPDTVSVSTKAKSFDQVHWFVKNREQMEKELPHILSLVKGPVTCWIYYPKGSSGLQTDLTRDKGWDALLKEDRQWLSLISFNDTWSAFGMREKTEGDRKKEAVAPVREIFNYIDAATKTVRLPDELTAAFRKHPKESAIFEALPYSHRKEYVEWIVTAKREETKTARVKGTIEKLGKGWKNPSDR